MVVISLPAPSAEALAFLDDDCIARTNWLAELVTVVHRDPQVLIGASTVHPTPESPAVSARQVMTELVDDFGNPPEQESGIFTSLNFAMNRKRILALGTATPAFDF